MKQIMLYGITGADENYRVAKYFCVYEEDISIWFMRYKASQMLENYPSIEKIYAIDNYPGLKREFSQIFKHPSIEGWVAFKDFLERNAMLISF